MKYSNALVLILMVVGSTSVFGNQQTGIVKIISLSNWVGTPNYPNEEMIVVTNETTLINPSGCTKTDAYYLDAASAISRSMLLAAYVAKTNVILSIAGGSCSASTNRPRIVFLLLAE